MYSYALCHVCFTDGEISYQNQVEPDSRSSLRSNSVSTATITEDASLLSPTQAALDAWNPMESHFLSNWNLCKENTRDALLEDGDQGNITMNVTVG